ncbi:MAG: ATP-binding cassette domain-containing protein [Gammaproteobacteria bacterium]|nr:ATP-binding cassette domain-containing protein [Gammaproteobacteria bacterium]
MLPRLMPLLNLMRAELAFGTHPLLDRADFALESGERVGLIGRNGTGKSSLLEVIAGRIALDDGELQKSGGLRVVSIRQEPELPIAPTLRESLALWAELDSIDDDRVRWRVDARIVEFLHRFGLEGTASTAGLSGGERKRAALAGAFALEPDVLLLDEPTNHLDIEGIERLEDLLLEGPSTIVVTHDRAFLDRVATRIVELDRGLLRSYPGNYAAYERRKAEQLAEEAVLNRKFDKFWAQEEVWIRKGVEARRTRNEGRVKRLERLRVEREARRERMGNVKLALEAGERSGKLVAELRNVTKSFDGRAVVRNLDLRVMRGDRLGLVGPNGAGKSTLLKLILGTLTPDAGEVRAGSQVSVAYFDQLRAQLDLDATVAATVSPNSDWVGEGEARRHVVSYLADFLFPAQRVDSPVRMLSGGERNRLLLARLFARPANVLVMDEPTNDLDIESLELLEQTLQEYPGTLLLVSHDRTFLDNVVTQVLAPLGDGRWREYVGGYSDWVRQRPAVPPSPAVAGEGRGEGRRETIKPSSAEKKAAVKLSFKESRELEQLPLQIEALETEQRALAAAMSGAEYHRRGGEQMRKDAERATAIEQELEAAFERWAELDARKNALSRGG